MSFTISTCYPRQQLHRTTNNYSQNNYWSLDCIKLFTCTFWWFWHQKPNISKAEYHLTIYEKSYVFIFSQGAIHNCRHFLLYYNSFRKRGRGLKNVDKYHWETKCILSFLKSMSPEFLKCFLLRGGGGGSKTGKSNISFF